MNHSLSGRLFCLIALFVLIYSVLYVGMTSIVLSLLAIYISGVGKLVAVPLAMPATAYGLAELF